MTFFKNLVKIHFFTKLVENCKARGTTSPKYTGDIQNLISVLENHPSEFEKRLKTHILTDHQSLIFQSIFFIKLDSKVSTDILYPMK